MNAPQSDLPGIAAIISASAALVSAVVPVVLKIIDSRKERPNSERQTTTEPQRPGSWLGILRVTPHVFYFLSLLFLVTYLNAVKTELSAKVSLNKNYRLRSNTPGEFYAGTKDEKGADGSPLILCIPANHNTGTYWQVTEQ